MKKSLAILGLSIVLGSCAGTPPDRDPKTGATANCVFQTDKEAKVFTDFNGTRVGFCCKKCKAKWDELPDGEKGAMVADKETR